MTDTVDRLRRAAAALGATRDEADQLAAADAKLSRPEAERALGGTATPRHPNPFAAGAQPPRPRQGQRRLTRRAAARQLGELTLREQRQAWFIAGEWRSRTLARFRTKAGRAWLVKLVETQMTGAETSIPPEIDEAITHALEADRSRHADCPTLASVAHAHVVYQQIARELKKSGRLG